MSAGSILVPAESLREQVERAIAAQIVSGQKPPGEVLTVPTLAEAFGVSATPVREAMLNLARRGFLQPIRNRGFQVTEVSDGELDELAAVRLLLEAPPMRQIAGAVDAELGQELRGLADRIVAAAKARRFEEYLDLDSAFHLRILAVTGNQKLVDIVGELRQQTRLVGLVRLANAGTLLPTAREHSTLVDLLVRGDGDGAEELMRRHIGHVGGVWSGRTES